MMRKMTMMFAATAALVLGLAGAANAATTDGPYSYSGSDSGTCHPYDNAFNEVPWALDIGNRTFTVTAADPAGNYKIVERFRHGNWTAVPDPGPNGPGSVPAAGARLNYSPGDCDGSDNQGGGPDVGHRIIEGSQGTFTGIEHLFIQHGTYTAGDGTCAGEDANGSPNPCTTDGYVAYHYGNSATTTLTSYRFNYIGTVAPKNAPFIESSYTDSWDGSTYNETGDIYNKTVTPTATMAANRHRAS